MSVITFRPRHTLLFLSLLLTLVAGCRDSTGLRSLDTGMKKLQEGDIAGAVRQLQRAVAVRPTDPSAHCNLGMAYARTNRHADAIAAFREAERLAPRDPRPLELIVHSLLALNNPDAARESARKALAIAPEEPRLTTLLACVEARDGNDAEARKLLTEALRLNRDYAPALYDLGMLNLKGGGRKELAENLLKRFLEQVPADARAEEVRATLASLIAPPPQPEPTIEPPAQKAPPPPPPPPPVSRDIPATAALPIPDNRRAHDANAEFSAAVKAQDQGQTRLAMQHYQEALRIDPSMAKASYNLGLIHLKANKNEAAQEAFEAAIRVDASMEKAYLQAGVAALNRGRSLEALQHFTTVIRMNRSNIEARYLAGVACVNLKKQDSARAHFAAYLKLAPRGPMAGYIRTWMKNHP